MYRSKKDVDKHVEGLISKLSLKEFKSRAYSVARLYFEVGDYSSCQRYVEQYLSQKDNNAAAHKLLGQALHKLGQKEKALEQYKTSLDIDPMQASLVLDICELLADDEVFIDPSRAKFWCEKAEATFPRHPVTFRLRERLIASVNSDPEALVSLLTAELAVRPKDPTLHARLLKHYLQSNKIKEAFNHSCNVEFGGNTFLNNCAWYETLAEILKHNSLDKKDCLYQVLNLTVRERLCVLSLTETPNGTSKSLVESNELLHQYDQAIETTSKTGAPLGNAEFHAGLLQHHHGQFAFHAATFLLKKAKKDQLSWRDATRIAAPLILIAWHTVPLDTKVSWLAQATEKLRIAVHRWYVEGSYRCSQAGHYLLSNIQDKSQSSLDHISQSCSGKNWRDKLYEKIFNSRDHLSKKHSSHMVTDAFNSPILRLPRKIEVEAYDVDAQRQYPNSLHHFVWVLINYKNYAHFQCSLFDMVIPKSRNYMNSGPETLNKLDIFAFLYSAALTTQQQRINQNAYDTNQKPKVLPANITDLLCPLTQMKWWDCAYKFSQNQLGTELTDFRATLSRGIEVIRCVDNHGLDPEMLCLLGRIFSERAKSTTAVEEKTNLETRAGLYYNSAIPLLEKVKSKIVIKVPEKRMFNYTHVELTNKDLNAYIEESKIYVAVNHLNESEYERALEMLGNLKSPKAYFHLSETYKRMALEEQSLPKDNESKLKLATLLSKARNFAYKTLDRLKETQEDSKHPLYSETQELIEEIETNINRLDPDLSGTILNDVDGKYSSDENVSSTGSEHVITHTNSHAFRNLSSTPKHPSVSNVTNYRTAIDSQIFETTRNDQKYLERIEKEIKNLQKRDATISSFMEQTKHFFEENRNLSNQVITTINCNIQNTTDQFKLLKISVDQVKDQIDECRNECKDVGELKKQVADLKKEVNKLKKTSSEQNIDENDLYNLDEEYRTNESTSGFAAQLPFAPSQVLPQFNQRLVPPFPAVPPNPYQFYGQSLYNLYNQYSQFSQAPQVPGAPPLFDSARSQVGYPGVYPTPEQMYPDVSHLIPPTMPAIPAKPPVPPTPVTLPTTPSAPVIPPVSIPKSTSSVLSKETTRSLPVNVVITSSDPLPTCTTAPQPILSVTIPPKHIKGTPHNYQIQMPTTSETQVMQSTIFSTGIPGSTINSTTTTKPFTAWNEATTFKSAQTPGSTPKAYMSSNNSGFSLFDSPKMGLFDNSISVVDGNILSGASPNTSLNKSRTLSERSNTSVENYDPCPDFKPIVPLPAEITVTTGEEDETAIFRSRAKLFRFVDKQWKERGIGEIKLLKHKVTGKVRVLMRREQVHKICANHIIRPEMEMKPMKNETKAYFWSANDFADNSIAFEKFSVRFKTEDIAKQFYETFEKARQEAKSSPQKPKSSDAVPIGAQTIRDLLNTPKREPTKPIESQANKTVVGGFTFSSTPTFKSVKEDKPEAAPAETATTKANPFSAISFKSNTSSPFSNLFSATSQSNSIVTSSPAPSVKQDTQSKFNTSDTVEEFEPTVEFKPVVPLPALVDHKTGEEDETVLFEHRAKLLRFESSKKEWKERGLGNIKLLAQKDNSQKVRLLMRREQVMKVCCNHALTKELVFEKMPHMDKAVTWCAKDFSEGELVAETFCLRFKTVQACDDFIAAVKSAQAKLIDESKAAKEEQNAAKQTNQVGFGDKFKPKAGSWSCELCYTNNLESFLKCACCEQPKPQTGKVNNAPAAPAQATPLNWGDKFKPKTGTWECKECYIRNEGNVEYCGACNSPKDSSMAKKETKSAVDGTPKFSFGIPSQTSATLQASKDGSPITIVSPVTTAAPVSGWGEKFKPKEGSWECKQCFVRNEGNLFECNACTSPKDPSAPKKESKSIFDNASSGPKFSFGIPAAAINENKTSALPPPLSMFDGTGGHKFSFGVPKNPQEQSPAMMFGNIGATSVIFATPKKPENQLGSPLDLILKKNEDLSVTVTPVKPALLPTPQKDAPFGSKEGGTFDFVFKPKTPSKGKSPVKSPKSEKGEESDDNEYASEDEGHHLHFSPVVPLPDKVEVVTGEENEDELYGHRAKLFRFTAGEWKERGIGVVKILKHKQTGKLRVVMRREQVLKICLNHALTLEIMYTPKDDKTWLFPANDYSEGELNLQQFCLRFKTKEIASEFKDAIDKATGAKAATLSKDSVSDDVVFVKEIQATKEEKARAKELMLPENFFTYKSKSPCHGCRGCDDSDEAEPATASGFAVDTPLKTSTTSTPTFFSPATSFYGTPANFNKTADNSIFRTPLESIGSNTGKTPLFTNNRNAGNGAIDKENAFTPKGDVFSRLGDKKSLFGTPPGSPALDSSDTQTPTSTKSSSILAPPKLSTINTSTEDKTLTPEPKSLFGSQATKSIFGNSGDSENTSIFDATDKKSIFGTATENKSIFSTTCSAESKPLFGTVTSTDNKSIFSTSNEPLFGNANSTENKSIFGLAPATENKSIFGTATTTETKPVFGGASLFVKKDDDKGSKPEVKSLFGSDTDQKPVNLFQSSVQGSIFGPNVASNNQAKPAPGLFGSTGGSIFGNNAFGASKSLFGNNQNTEQKKDDKPSIFDTKKTEEVKNEKEAEKKEGPFSVDNSLSFAALSTSGPGFNIQKKEDFKWEGAGAQLFHAGHKQHDKSKTEVESGAGEDAEVEGRGDEEYDPHYEPIVPLPDKIVVTTGEEEEEKTFGERAKLYRYDEKTREWKERGVGELKLLYHPQKNTYRLLLRREQVHKAVLNMLVHMDLELLPMKNSDRAWTWAGINYAESTGDQEMLAVRFKSVDLAHAFLNKVTEAVRKLQAAAAQAIREQKEAPKPIETVAPLRAPKHLEAAARADPVPPAFPAPSQSTDQTDGTHNGVFSTASVALDEKPHVHFREPEEEDQADDEDDYDHNYDEYENYGDYYNEEDEASTYYRCEGSALVTQGENESSCPEAQIQVMFDQDAYSPKILVTDAATGEILADMLIHTETEFQMEGDSCTWTGTDYTTSEALDKTVTVNFADSETAMQFYDSCETSKAATYSSVDPES